MDYFDGVCPEVRTAFALHRYNVTKKYTETGKKCNSLVYYIKGGHEFVFENQTITASEGELLFLPQGSKYTNTTLSPDTEYYQLGFVFCRNNDEYAPIEEPFKITLPESMEFCARIKAVYDGYSVGGRGYEYICGGEILKMIGMLLVKGTNLSKKEMGIDRIEKTVSYIEEYYYLDTSLDELAKLSATCTSNLEKLFKKCFGKSPIEYRNEIRIRNAKRLLAGGLSISETASLTGFSDRFYFSNTFKKLCGKTPGEFVKEIRTEW